MADHIFVDPFCDREVWPLEYLERERRRAKGCIAEANALLERLDAAIEERKT
jgi:hypothetical protein